MPAIEEIEASIREFLPRDIGISEIRAEGPKIAVTTDRLDLFIDHDNIAKDLARSIKKRVLIRPVNSLLMAPTEAEAAIRRICGSESGINDVMFNPYQKEVMIEAEKLGNVIGEGGSNIKRVIRETGWTPMLERTTPLKSNILTSLRKTLWDKKVCRKRKEFLDRLGREIYRKADHTCDWIRVTPLGGAGEVGRSCFIVQTPNSNVLLDCGINVAASDAKRMFPDFRAMQLAIDDLDAVIISHAHLDHCGFVPYLYRYGYDGPIYATKPTRDIMAMLQLDAVEISAKEDKELPYSSPDIRNVIEHVIPLEYNEVADITTDSRLTLYNAGHILGSSIIHLHIGDSLYNIVYTGDIKFGETKLLNPADYEFPRLETLIIESTYGGRKSIQPKRKEAEEFLIKSIKNTVDQGGKVLIPVFAVGRSQEVMITLEEYMKNELAEVPVYVDGMVYEATAIHTAYPEYLKRRLKTMILRGANPFLAKNFIKVNTRERIDIAESTDPCIIVTPSGMMTGGPSVEYFKRMAGNEKDLIVFVGYQAEGSLGRRVQKGMREVVIMEGKKPKNIDVKINVVTIEGFSGHADRRQLLGYVKRLHPRPERIMTVHGESKKCADLARGLSRIFHVDTRVPMNLDTIRII
ncbi:MAG: beta-CASP ribonuclease aCPSF1 [Candidatus Altiarchaeota archaeon]|nr:beta-CASP ribonuclease aCPSF1 [Candidatus Altiarchaeota archaeon]